MPDHDYDTYEPFASGEVVKNTQKLLPKTRHSRVSLTRVFKEAQYLNYITGLEKRKRTADIDFIYSYNVDIFPIEVKADKLSGTTFYRQSLIIVHWQTNRIGLPAS